MVEHRFVADDDDRSPAAADCGVDQLARQHCDRFFGQDDRDRIELGALRLVHGHRVAQFDEFAHRFESERDEVVAARKYRHRDLRAVAAPDPQQDSIVAVEESALVVVAQHDQRLADHEWNALCRDAGGFSGARMKPRIYSLGAGLEDPRHAQDARFGGVRKQQAQSLRSRRHRNRHRVRCIHA